MGSSVFSVCRVFYHSVTTMILGDIVTTVALDNIVKDLWYRCYILYSRSWPTDVIARDVVWRMPVEF
jgi:membrane-associated PAP2 superfamily phosphatase